jgi:hypothetical protein
VPDLIAEGPARYLGGSIETFALPMGLFIAVALILFFIYRRPHRLPALRYLRSAEVAAVATPEANEARRAETTSAAASSVVQERMAKAARGESDSVGDVVSADSSSGAAGPLSDTATIDGTEVRAEDPPGSASPPREGKE